MGTLVPTDPLVYGRGDFSPDRPFYIGGHGDFGPDRPSHMFVTFHVFLTIVLNIYVLLCENIANCVKTRQM